jgi:adenine-specific DNA-methyltransferase
MMAKRREDAADIGPEDEAQARGQSADYEHQNPAAQRPLVGVQEEFPNRRAPRTYRYDSSLSPELAWDENAERELAEWLLGLIEGATLAVTEAAQQGKAAEAEVAYFAQAPGWAGTGERFGSLAECVARLKSLTRPFLNWAGKAERQLIRVPTIPLFVHERHSTQAILGTLEDWKAVGTTADLFGDSLFGEPGLDMADQLDAYEHLGPWSNRLVLGDSLQVMNSLLEYEGLGGQVQMIYMDPPYGVKFGSNFQPFVRKRDVRHGQDADMIREPEMVKAYRDTWRLGLHSYLTLLRDRLLLARELLTESGSIFVQISDENLHHVREVMDEIFGAANFCGVISFYKTSSQSTTRIPSIVDFLLVYAKDIGKQKFSKLVVPKETGARGAKQYTSIVLPDMETIRKMTSEELSGATLLPEGWKICRLGPLTSQGYQESRSQPLEFEGRVFPCPRNRHWSYDPSPGGEISRLMRLGRVRVSGNSLASILIFDDNPVTDLDNIWLDTGTGSFTEEQTYSVQTAQKVVQRCILMTTDPGDLVFDPTCGSGTTAYVAEQWGRRWITCDTSRVPLALARQRLLTATFPWYELKEPKSGPAGGFVYQRKQNRKGEEVGGLVPRITLKSIANGEDPETVTLVDRPEVNPKVTRVCGRFTVEATVQAARSVEEPAHAVGRVSDSLPRRGDLDADYENPRVYLDRMIEVLRQSRTLRLPENESLALDKVRALPAGDFEHLHAEAVLQNGEGKRLAICFGPEHSAIDSALVMEAHREAYSHGFDALCLFGFAIEGKARELIGSKDAAKRKLKLRCIYVNVTPDVVMSDLLKTSKSSEVFSVTGLPDARVERAGESPTGEPLYRVRLLGLDIFRPHDLETEAIAADNLPCWMLDTDYNGLVFMARQVFFPKTSAWSNLERSLRGRFAEGVWEHLAGTESEPFAAGPRRQVAIKVIDERGNELMVVKGLGG